MNSKNKYYNYKKKIGRHKKPGPKKKKKIRGRRWQEPWNFKIIICNNRKQVKYINKYRNLDNVITEVEKLKEKNNKVEFQSKYVIKKGTANTDIRYEYVILKRISDEIDSTSQVRNDFGKIVDVKTNSENWIIYDRFPCLIEETFWVYGYNPRTDRKTFQWIKENIINSYICDKYSILLVTLYNNKIILKYDNNDFDFVICKNMSDSIRMYNKLKEDYKKQKNIIFTGLVTKKNEKTNEIVNMLKEKTGWTLDKIYRKSTR